MKKFLERNIPNLPCVATTSQKIDLPDKNVSLKVVKHVSCGAKTNVEHMHICKKHLPPVIEVNCSEMSVSSEDTAGRRCVLKVPQVGVRARLQI